jgi:hypothetical protein
LLLLRFDARALLSLLFQEPPRSTLATCPHATADNTFGIATV